MFKLLLSTVMVCASFFAHTQNVLNFSFENVNTPPCAYNLSNAALNGQILDVTAFGTYGDCDVMSGNCGFGTPQNGNWFFGLSVPPQPNPISDAIAMKLSSPLVAGTTYTLSLYGKKDVGYPANPLEIGYSVNDVTQGTVVDTIAPFASASWTNYTVTFTPSISAQYITLFVQPILYGWNHIDNVQLQIVSGTNQFNSLNNGWAFFQQNEQLEINFLSTQKNTTITVYNLQGKLVAEKKLCSQSSSFISTKNFSSSVYWICIMHEDGLVESKKFFLSR